MRQELLAGSRDWDILWHGVVGRDDVSGIVLLLCIEGVATIQQSIQDDAARPDVSLLQAQKDATEQSSWWHMVI